MSIRVRSITVDNTAGGTMVYKVSGGDANFPQYVRITTDADVYIAGSSTDVDTAASRLTLTSTDAPLVFPALNGAEIYALKTSAGTAEVSVFVTRYDGQHDDVNPDT